MAKIHGLIQKNIALDRSYILNTPSPTERGEVSVMSSINGIIDNIGSPIDIKVGNQLFKNVYGVNKVGGTPKADLSLVSFVNDKFVDICFFSHKMGGGAKAFQQYVSVTGGPRDGINDHPFLQKVLRFFVRRVDAIKKVAHKVYIPMNSSGRLLIQKSIYGPDFKMGSRRFGIDNVNFIAQGDAGLKREGNNTSFTYNLIFGDGISLNGDLSHFSTGDYKPVILARYTVGRNFYVDGKRYTGMRILIAPTSLRNNAIVLKVD